ncbi:MAG: GIY-YIG nuclease family protein [Candidatus Liptonbacteria bacterium]|nr:GIY-YIG nuclease family protein [Candidatus Liptonbacteria bacterium]
MHYIYVLYSLKDHGFYIGKSDDLKQRIVSHNSGSVLSTRNRRPLKLIHYEAFLFPSDATAREKYLKSGYGRQQLRDQCKDLFRWLDKK